MNRLRTLTGVAAIGALIISLGPAAGQEAQPAEEAQGEMGLEQMMRSMMRDMMEEMLEERGASADEPSEATESRDRQGGPHGRRMGRGHDMERHHMKRRVEGHRPRHAMRMKFGFAIMDADGSGGVSLQEAQDFQARIFNAMDADNDGEVTMEEIGAFFHGPTEMQPR